MKEVEEVEVEEEEEAAAVDDSELGRVTVALPRSRRQQTSRALHVKQEL